MHLGIAHHLGWAIAVTATADHEVVDRRRIELIEPGIPAAPIHHEGGAYALHRTGEPLADDALAALATQVRDAKDVETAAARVLAERADAVLRPAGHTRPSVVEGPPHRAGSHGGAHAAVSARGAPARVRLQRVSRRGVSELSVVNDANPARVARRGRDRGARSRGRARGGGAAGVR
jgi:hypothetical protein